MKKVASLAPTQLPPLDVLIDDLHGDRSPESIGRHLGVSGPTVRRWIKSGQAHAPPRWPCFGKPAGGCLRCTLRPITWCACMWA